MNPTIKRYLISSVTTFCAMFLGTLAVEIQAGIPTTFTEAFFMGLFGSAFRAAVKAVVESATNMSGDSVVK